MKKIAEWICNHKIVILITSVILFLFSIVGSLLTSINYDILVYLPEDETIKAQNILTDDFEMGGYSVIIAENMPSKDLLNLEKLIKNVEGVNEVVSIYDVIGTSISIEYLPSEIVSKMNVDNCDLLFVTFNEGTSSESTLNAIKEIRNITNDKIKISGMSAMVLDTQELSQKEIAIYVIIAVILCLLVLELSLDSYLVPILLLLNIGASIIFNLGSNIIFGEISYITKALVAVLQLGVTTDFSIFLYHAYKNKKKSAKTKEAAMRDAICETFTSVTGSSLTTIAGFLVLCTMSLTLGKDLGLVMAKGVFLGVICVLTLFPSLLLFFDKGIEKTSHKPLTIKFNKLNNFVIKHHISILFIFLILFVPFYLANKNVPVYYKLDESLPSTLGSIVANNELKEKFNIVSPEIVLINKNLKVNVKTEMIEKIKNVEGIDFVLSYAELEQLGFDKEILSPEIKQIFTSDNHEIMLINSTYDIATDELNNQVDVINKIIKEYDKDGILAGEGALMKDLVKTSDEDFNNVNASSIICILIIMFFVLKSLSLPFILISVIEFAIFGNMAVSYFSGDVLPFIAPIVLSTIQLGATIDYAILLTTTYLKERHKGLDKKEAMLNTTNYCANSVFVSGLCFFAATFGVGVYSDLEMVGSLCTLIARGAIISMVVVIMILPSVLLILDKFIMATTYRKKDIMKNKKIKKVLGALLIVTNLLVPSQIKALEKSETIYGKLNSDGTYKTITVSEHLINDLKEDTIKDYSDLEEIINTNGDEVYYKEKNMLTWDAKGNDIFYKGVTKKELPIKEVITYELDGEKHDLEEIIGKSGHIKITIKYINTAKHAVKINNKLETIYTPFVAITTTMLDATNTNLKITNGKIVNNGDKYLILGISTPGLYESLSLKEFKGMDKVIIEFDTQKFELSSIYSVITPKLISSSDLDIFNKMDNLKTNINTLQDNMNVIETSSGEILQGITKINDGSSLISTNLNNALIKLEEVLNGTKTLNGGIKEVVKALEVAEEALTSEENLVKMLELQKLIKINTDTQKNMQEELLKVTNTYEQYNLKELDYMTILSANYSDDVKNMLLGAKYTYENMLSTNLELAKLIEANTTALTSSLTTINELSKKLSELKSSLILLEQGSTNLVNGVDLLTIGIDTLNAKTKELVLGTNTLNIGMDKLYTGIKIFNKEGINTLSTTVNTVNNLGDKLNKVLELGDNYQTISSNIKNVKQSTKIVYVVDGVKIKEEVKEEKKEVKKLSFWKRLINLFKKN